MKTRTINVTFKIEDNDVIEYAFEKELRGHFESENTKITDYQVLPDTNAMYEKDSTYRALCSDLRKLKQKRNDYIYNHNKKYLK